MIETSGEGGSAWLTPPLGGINSSLKERERERNGRAWTEQIWEPGSRFGFTLILGVFLCIISGFYNRNEFICGFHLRATKGVVPTPKVFSMSHFLYLE